MEIFFAFYKVYIVLYLEYISYLCQKWAFLYLFSRNYHITIDFVRLVVPEFLILLQCVCVFCVRTQQTSQVKQIMYYISRDIFIMEKEGKGYIMTVPT